MREANAEISRENTGGLFVTMLAGILDTRSGLLEYCNAGHEPPYPAAEWRAAAARLMDGGGPPLCAVDCFSVRGELPTPGAGRHALPRDRRRDRRGEPGAARYGRNRLEAVLAQAGSAASAADVGDAIRREFARFTDGVEPSDDMAILVVRWKARG